MRVRHRDQFRRPGGFEKPRQQRAGAIVNAVIGLGVGQGAVQMDILQPLHVLDDPVEQSMEALMPDFGFAGLQQAQHQPRGKMTEIDGDAGIHFSHA